MRRPGSQGTLGAMAAWPADDLVSWWGMVDRWIAAACDTLGLTDVSPIDRGSARICPWGVTVPVETSSGRLYFKAAEPRRAFESAVTETIASGWPTLAPTVHAADHARNWMLLGDHGDQIAAVLSPADQSAAVEALLPAYGQMQASTRDLVEQWVTLGVPDRRVDTLADQFDAFLTRGSVDAELHTACLEPLARVRATCHELAASAQPDAIEHADIHGTNVLTRDGEHRLIDWGDACVTHPFTAVFTPIEFIVGALPRVDRPRAARRLRDAYLEAWGGATRANVADFERAQQLAPLVRVLSLAGEHDSDAEIDELLRAWISTTTSL